jgi:hypothetical protein
MLLTMSEGVEVVGFRGHCADNVSALLLQSGSGCAVFSMVKHVPADTKVKKAKRQKGKKGKKVRNDRKGKKCGYQSPE